MNKYELAVIVNVKLEDEERAATIEKVKLHTDYMKDSIMKWLQV